MKNGSAAQLTTAQGVCEVAYGWGKMEKHFEAATKGEAIEMANLWWSSSTGLKRTLTLVFGAESYPATWKVVVHYEPLVSAIAADKFASRD